MLGLDTLARGGFTLCTPLHLTSPDSSLTITLAVTDDRSQFGFRSRPQQTDRGFGTLCFQKAGGKQAELLLGQIFRSRYTH